MTDEHGAGSMHTESNGVRALPGPTDALVVVDVQRDFLPGGNLAVARGDRILPPINRCIEQFAQRMLPVFATRR